MVLVFIRIAEKQSTKALPRRLLSGRGVQKNRETAGSGYLPSKDDPKRPQIAFDYFRKGAELGEAGYMNKLGVMLMTGECTMTDEKKGFRRFESSYYSPVSDLGDHAQAAHNPAIWYHCGR